MQMNVQVHHVVTDITGVTGMRIIRAIVSGIQAPEMLAEFRDARCAASPETIRAALTGNYRRSICSPCAMRWNCTTSTRTRLRSATRRSRPACGR